MWFETRSWSGNQYLDGREQCYLLGDNWDDFGFKTTFQLLVFDDEGNRHEPGHLKIGRAGMTGGPVEVPGRFEQLPDDYFSLGLDQNYYETLMELPVGLRDEILRGLRDCAFDELIYERFKEEEVMTTSLLRGTSRRRVQDIYASILAGNVRLTPFAFRFTDLELTRDGADPFQLSVGVQPDSMPPTNVHVLIGRNGAGKTRLLLKLAEAFLREGPRDRGLEDAVDFLGEEGEDYGRFSSLVAVSFSAFDRFDPGAGVMSYSYVGLRREARDDGAEGEPQTPDAVTVGGPGEEQPTEPTLKSLAELESDFASSLRECLQGPRLRRWRAAMETLSSDPGIASLGLADTPEEPTDADHARIVDAFRSLSAGHKIVLLSATRLVEFVDERSLVLIDEPETHLHPPLLGSFTRAVSELLVRRNGVAIMATHSPVVIQEVPRNCVHVIRRSGDEAVITHPESETFAENVGVLTREVFGLELTASGYYRLLSRAADSGDFQAAVQEFEGRVGGEGLGILRALVSRLRGQE